MRLYLTLPEATRAIIDGARRTIDHFVVIATLSTLTSVFAVALAIFGSLGPAVWIPTACGFALLAFITYRSGVSAALTVGDLVRSAIDLHRRKLLTELHLVLPPSTADEKEVWDLLAKHQLGHSPSAAEYVVLRFDSDPGAS
ncbi:MAG: hypothetical protein WBB07_21370 [Mycobacterium sp.]